MAKTKHNKTLLFNLLSFFLIVLLFFLCLEIVLRVAYSTYSNFNTEMWRYSTEIKTLSNVPGVSHEHLPNKESLLYGVTIKTNSLGFRSYDYPANKLNNTFRILVMGDSVTLGWGVNLSDSYPIVLEKKLNNLSKTNKKNINYEVFNSAVGNYNTEMEVNILEKYLYLNPDAVVIGFFPNDGEKTPTIKTGLLYELKRRLFIYPFFWDKITKIEYSFMGKSGNYSSKVHSFYTTEYGGKERIDVAFSKLRLLEKSKNFKVYIVLIPQLYNEFKDYDLNYLDEFVNGLCRKYNFTCINTLNSFTQYKLQDVIISMEDAHPNPLSHNLIAQDIFEVISNEKT